MIYYGNLGSANSKTRTQFIDWLLTLKVIQRDRREQ
jgi:hypothetical protein